MRNIGNPSVLEDLVTRLGGLTPAQPCVWGTMNAQQMALHLGDASAAVLKQRPFKSTPRERPATLQRFVLLHLLPAMPRGIKSGAEPAAVVTDPARFGSDVERAASLLQQLAAASPDTLVNCHPILGPMTRSNWMRWAFMHTDHHLRQFGL